MSMPGVISLAALLLLWGPPATAAPEGANPPLQVLVVTAPDWSDFHADLEIYERKDPKSPWISAGERIPAVVGRKGLAWGRGVFAGTPDEGPQKREGDGKAPAGIFKLGFAFGYPPGESVPWVRLPYRQMTKSSRCVDDSASPFYNRLVDEGRTPKSWQSHEEMRRDDDQYSLGIVIEHNTEPVTPDGGSCIFLHIWAGPNQGTSGCTAVSAQAMEAILRKLKPEANPLLIQLPRKEYERLREQGAPIAHHMETGELFPVLKSP